MRIGFAGTPEFAQQALDALIKDGQSIVVVLTQPDRPAGRGMQVTASPVKQCALKHGIEVLQPRSLKLDGSYPEDARVARARLESLELDALVVAAYGLILPAWTLALPRYGCLNIHASLLPRWRGAAPIQRAIEAGDPHTGITIMQMDQGLDTGDMLLRGSMAIAEDETSQTLHDRLAALGAELIVTTVHQLADNTLTREPQPLEGVTYAQKLQKSESALDASQHAIDLERRVRAFNPFPGTTLRLAGLPEPVKIWQAKAIGTAHESPPGRIVAVNPQGIDIATGQGLLRLLELQKPGGKRQPVAAFVQGNPSLSGGNIEK